MVTIALHTVTVSFSLHLFAATIHKWLCLNEMDYSCQIIKAASLWHLLLCLEREHVMGCTSFVCIYACLQCMVHARTVYAGKTYFLLHNYVSSEQVCPTYCWSGHRHKQRRKPINSLPIVTYATKLIRWMARLYIIIIIYMHMYIQWVFVSWCNI